MGIDGSKTRHRSTQQYYRDTQKLVDSLKAEVVDLLERKEATQKELRQAKKEVSRLTRLVEKLCAWFPLAKEALRIERLCRLIGFDERQTATLVSGRPYIAPYTPYEKEEE